MQGQKLIALRLTPPRRRERSRNVRDVARKRLRLLEPSISLYISFMCVKGMQRDKRIGAISVLGAYEELEGVLTCIYTIRF